ncbi:MAG: hypothetical protein WA373_05775 [Burkholderiales bacterium]
MKLHQIKLEFSAEHDRLLLRVSSEDGKELLLWLTRRCVKLLWPALVDAAQASPEIALQADPEAKKALLGFQHEKAVNRANFSRPYEDAPRERPPGVDPILVARIQARRDQQGRCVLSLPPVEGPRIHFTLDDTLLHSFCRLLQTSVAKASWDIALALPQSLTPVAPAGGVRTLN